MAGGSAPAGDGLRGPARSGVERDLDWNAHAGGLAGRGFEMDLGGGRAAGFALQVDAQRQLKIVVLDGDRLRQRLVPGLAGGQRGDLDAVLPAELRPLGGIEAGGQPFRGHRQIEYDIVDNLTQYRSAGILLPGAAKAPANSIAPMRIGPSITQRTARSDAATARCRSRPARSCCR